MVDMCVQLRLLIRIAKITYTECILSKGGAKAQNGYAFCKLQGHEALGLFIYSTVI